MGISDDIRPRRPRSVHPSFEIDYSSVLSTNHPNSVAPTENHFDIASPTTDQTTEQQHSHAEHTSRSSLEDQFFSTSHALSHDGDSKQPADKPKRKKRIGWAIAALALIIIAASQYPLVAKRNSSPDNSQTTQQPPQSSAEFYTGEVITQDYSSGKDTGNDAAVNTTPNTNQTVPTTQPAQDTTPDKSGIKIKVLNGNGITGSAQKVQNQLVQAGFTVGVVSNASRFSYTKTYIYHQTGKESEANLVAAALSNRSTIVTSSDSVAGSYHVVVVVGRE